MNREILFRAWDTERNMFVPEGEIVFCFYGSTHIEVHPNSLQYIGDSVHNGEPQRGRFIVSEGTGLNDKNGTPIYEGDIVVGHRGYMTGDGRLRKGFPDKVRIFLEVVYGDGKTFPVGFHLDEMYYHPDDKKFTDEKQYRSILYDLRESREWWLNKDHTVPWLGRNKDLEVIGNIFENPELNNYGKE